MLVRIWNQQIKLSKVRKGDIHTSPFAVSRLRRRKLSEEAQLPKATNLLDHHEVIELHKQPRSSTCSAWKKFHTRRQALSHLRRWHRVYCHRQFTPSPLPPLSVQREASKLPRKDSQMLPQHYQRGNQLVHSEEGKCSLFELFFLAESTPFLELFLLPPFPLSNYRRKDKCCTVT